MPLKHKNSDEANKHTPKGFDNASNFSRLLRDEIGQSRYTKEFIFPKAIDFVDGSAVPPTSDLNDIYVLIDTGGGAIDSSWGSVSYNDWVRYNGTTWGAVTPTAGDVCFDSTAGIYKVFGASWGQLVPDAPNIYDIDGTIGSGREATITDTLSFLGGNLIKKGSDTLSTTSNYKLKDSADADLWDFRNDGDIHQGKDSTVYLNAKSLTFDVGTNPTTGKGLIIDGTNNTSGASALFTIKNAVGSLVIVNKDGFQQNIVRSGASLASFYDSTTTKGFTLSTSHSTLASQSLRIQNTFATSSDRIETAYNYTTFYKSGVLEHWFRWGGGSEQFSFFMNGIGTAKFLVGGNATLSGEKISLQDDTLVGKTGSKVGFMGATPIVKVTTGVSAGAFVANTSGIADDTATFGGYTIGQIAQALINYGLLT